MDHHDDWMHWPPDEPDPHGDAPGHDDAVHDLGDPGHGTDVGHAGDVGGHDLDVDPFGDHLAGVTGHDPYGTGDDGSPGHDPYPADLRDDADLGDPPGHEPGSTVDAPAAEAGIDVHVVGVDHDALPGDAADPDFPPPLDLPDRPEPVDGYPWSDPATLGDIGTVSGAPQFADAGPPVDDLLSYAGMDPPGPGVDPWAAMADSDDPAVSALARWWGPAT